MCKSFWTGHIWTRQEAEVKWMLYEFILHVVMFDAYDIFGVFVLALYVRTHLTLPGLQILQSKQAHRNLWRTLELKWDYIQIKKMEMSVVKYSNGCRSIADIGISQWHALVPPSPLLTVNTFMLYRMCTAFFISHKYCHWSPSRFDHHASLNIN